MIIFFLYFPNKGLLQLFRRRALFKQKTFFSTPGMMFYRGEELHSDLLVYTKV
jgi:hypothetical protein